MSELSAGLQAIFDNSKDDFRRRVGTLEEAVAAIVAGNLGEDLRAVAERDAHKLAGSLGTFGMSRGSELACELEQRLARAHDPAEADQDHLTELVVELRAQLDGCLPTEAAAASPMASFEAGLAGPDTAAVMSGRILVVDDDLPVRRALVSILADAGYDVCDVGSAREARHALQHDTIALLLSDVSMPGETGLDLIRYALSEHPQTATLLISALEDPGIAQVAMDFGAYGYLSKPVRRSPVLIGVMTALRRRDSEVRERAARDDLENTVRTRTSSLSDALDRLEGVATQSRELQAETIHRWAKAAEYRDPGIGRHLKRVSHFCAMMSEGFGLHSESVQLASVLHDVGKSAMPDNILLKPGSLTRDERYVIETHAEIGHEMLRDSCSSLLDLAAVIARSHHEKFDGSGYPRGLSGTDIPLEGRIVAVADVFDAITCNRIYREAWSVDKAIEWMRNERGRHFDPSVLDVFLASMDEVLAVRSLLTSD